MVAGGAARVGRLGLQQRADLAQREPPRSVRAAIDAHMAGRRLVEADHHPHGGRLTSAVRSEEPGDLAVGHHEAQVVDRDRRAVALGEPPDLDHDIVGFGRGARVRVSSVVVIAEQPAARAWGNAVSHPCGRWGFVSYATCARHRRPDTSS